MQNRWIAPALLWTAACGSLFAQGRSATASRTLTGCLDEHPGPQYVLRGEHELRLLAELTPGAFPVEGFAKYLGHKVEVTGTVRKSAAASDGTPNLEVRRIRSLSATCAPGDSPAERAPQADRSAPRRGTASRAAGPRTATGCLDEKPGPQYVLRDPADMRTLFALEPDGFPVQGFAKHLGHQVRLEGSSYESEGTPVMKVRKIQDLSAVCAPSAQDPR